MYRQTRTRVRHVPIIYFFNVYTRRKIMTIEKMYLEYIEKCQIYGITPKNYEDFCREIKYEEAKRTIIREIKKCVNS